ncbi:MAG: SDR family NAD(P)-dependent oxidoreductase [Pseudomonadota bacterium]
MNSYDLSGRRAVVTGGASGIGKGIAQRFIASGATVMIWERERSAAEAAAAELNCGFVEVDVADWERVRSAAARTAAEMGGVDILVNSAGIGGKNDIVVEMDPESWADVINVNLNGTFHCCKAIGALMAEADYGRIVNIASIAGKEGNPTASHYSASKAGVIALTKSMGKEFADKNICVNCITPVTVDTPILEQLTPEFIDYMLSKIPRGRFLTVDEVTSMVCWLASEENSFETGGVFDISGGRATY